jgi:mannose-6-phosphate isomerase-like protein (cupin superfamily)
MDIFSSSENCTANDVDPQFPTSVIIPAGKTIVVAEGDTVFGFVMSGVCTIDGPHFRQEIREGMFFSLPGHLTAYGFHGMMCVRQKYQGLSLWGGPVERLGRLKYIDGCSDTLLVAPTIKGDPCLNYLYVPPNVDQTAHVHPSVRVGCIIEGAGTCRLSDGIVDLRRGTIFILPANETHSFHTANYPLRIVVYHPDSDFGPTDQVHPMLNRTLIGSDAAERS